MPRLARIYRLGLRARLSLTISLGALLLATVLSFLAWGLTRENLLGEKIDTATDEVLHNSVQVRKGLAPQGTTNVQNVLASLQNDQGATPLVRYNNQWHALDLTFAELDVPPALRDLVVREQAGRMIHENHQGRLMLVVGVPIPSVGAEYYEAFPLEDTERALAGLRLSLLGASLVTTLAAGLVGFYISRRALTPLIDVGHAAEAIAGGQLDTRLAVRGDPELDVLTTSFNEMARALQDRIERDARFASEVSHELRSPLMTLAASVEVLENSRDEMSERGQTALDLLKADVDRFQQLVEDLLEISRFDVGAVKLNMEEVLLPEMVIQAVSVSGQGPVPVVYEDDVSDAIVKVDKRRFGRVIANLLDNAMKYAGGPTRVQIERTPSDDAGPPTGVHAVVVPGSGAPASSPASSGTTERPTERRGPQVRIAVEDEGNGVPEEERQIIFDRFSRGSEGGNRASDSGVGLGLALVEEHIKLHGGRVWVEDRLDGQSGARFVIELPLVED